MNGLQKLLVKMVEMEHKQMLQSLMAQARNMGVEIRLDQPIRPSGRFTVTSDEKMIIEVREGVSVLGQVVVIAHELGHVYQFLLECNADSHEWYIHRLITHELDLESDAWLRAVEILKGINYMQWKYFKRYATYAYSTYLDKDEERFLDYFIDDLDKKMKAEVEYELV